MSGRFGRLASDELDYGYLQRGNATERRRSAERTSEFNGKQGIGRRKFTTPVSAKDDDKPLLRGAQYQEKSSAGITKPGRVPLRYQKGNVGSGPAPGQGPSGRMVPRQPEVRRPLRSAQDASASAGLDLRYDATDEKPWCVVVWPQGYEKRFVAKQDAYDYIKQIDKDEFWAGGKGAKHERERVR